MAECAGNCSEWSFGSMSADTAHTGPARVMRKCSVFKRGRFPDLNVGRHNEPKGYLPPQNMAGPAEPLYW
jgi:hypothetical protein